MQRNPYKYIGPLDPIKDKIVCIARDNETNKVISGINCPLLFLERVFHPDWVSPFDLHPLKLSNYFANYFVLSHLDYLLR